MSWLSLETKVLRMGNIGKMGIFAVRACFETVLALFYLLFNENNSQKIKKDR